MQGQKFKENTVVQRVPVLRENREVAPPAGAKLLAHHSRKRAPVVIVAAEVLRDNTGRS